MIIEVPNFSYIKNHKIDCYVNTLISALKVENITINEHEAMAISNGVAFKYIEGTKSDIPYMGFYPVIIDFFEQFAKRSNIKIKYYNYKDTKDDFDTIVDAISRNHCVTAVTDRFELSYAISNHFRYIYPEGLHMPHHYITIFGIDTEKKDFHICEPMLTLKKTDYWLNYDVIDKSRICDWEGLSIYRDIYIIEDVSTYDPKTIIEQLNSQLIGLSEQIIECVSKMKEFMNLYFNFYRNNQAFINENIQKLIMCLTSLDLTKHLYRNYLCNTVESCIDNNKIVNSYKNISQEWYNIASKAEKLVPSNDYTIDTLSEISNKIIGIINDEYNLHQQTLEYISI